MNFLVMNMLQLVIEYNACNLENADALTAARGDFKPCINAERKELDIIRKSKRTLYTTRP